MTDAIASEASAEAHVAGLQVLGRLIGRRQLETSEQVLDRFTALPKDQA